jgi:hypothetical protein
MTLPCFAHNTSSVKVLIRAVWMRADHSWLVVHKDFDLVPLLPINTDSYPLDKWQYPKKNFRFYQFPEGLQPRNFAVSGGGAQTDRWPALPPPGDYPPGYP